MQKMYSYNGWLKRCIFYDGIKIESIIQVACFVNIILTSFACLQYYGTSANNGNPKVRLFQKELHCNYHAKVNSMFKVKINRRINITLQLLNF